jgi:predicted phosphodiesterase
MPAVIAGDIHGDSERLAAFLDWAEATEPERDVVLLGDYVNHGSDSAGVLETLVRARRVLGSRLVLLRGNHDEAFLRFLRGGSVAPLLAMGGAPTVCSYLPHVEGDFSRRLRRVVPDSHVRLLEATEFSYRDGDLLALHRWPDEPIDDAGVFVVLGHYQQADAQPRIEESVAYLDTGCGRSRDGVLTAFCFPERSWRVF